MGIKAPCMASKIKIAVRCSKYIHTKLFLRVRSVSIPVCTYIPASVRKVRINEMLVILLSFIPHRIVNSLLVA